MESSANVKIATIIVAAGSSSRMGTGKPKIFERIGGVPVLARTLAAMDNASSINSIVIVCRDEDKSEIEQLAKNVKKDVKLEIGGNTRQQSVLNGIKQAVGADFFAIHDAARPLVSPEQIDKVCKDAIKHKAATLAVKVKDTIKLSDNNGFISETPERSKLVAVQTPQVFESGLYLRAFEHAKIHGLDFTDDCQLVEAIDEKVYLTEGSYENIKITTQEDLLIADAFVGESIEVKSMRVGSGYDVHKLVEDRKLILGGVDIPFEKGLLGHSDADVLLHAVSDALLGAAALGDIGKHFPDTDERFKDANSLGLLKEVVKLVTSKGYKIENIDATVVAQRPKLATYIESMRENIAIACEIDREQVNIKATTEENLGFTGSGEGISATAVCLIC